MEEIIAFSDRLDKAGEDEEWSQDDAETVFLEVRKKGLFQWALSGDLNMFGHNKLMGQIPILGSIHYTPFSATHRARIR